MFSQTADWLIGCLLVGLINEANNFPQLLNKHPLIESHSCFGAWFYIHVQNSTFSSCCVDDCLVKHSSIKHKTFIRITQQYRIHYFSHIFQQLISINMQPLSSKGILKCLHLADTVCCTLQTLYTLGKLTRQIVCINEFKINVLQFRWLFNHLKS
jgi:hypothetical protein